jgi:transcription elongation GreA/GreB family factor
MVITPQSPLGQTIMGRKEGQRWTTKLGGSTVKYHILSVSWLARSFAERKSGVGTL